MREMLEPIFGESGAVVAQFIITLIVVLVLVGFVYWLVRQFTGRRLHGAGHGRAPRLAIIDALSIDTRRKLVLIRRDHIEHLILIGGPSDLVVEPSIVRGVPAGSRPRQGQPQRPQPQQNVAAGQPPVPASQPHTQTLAAPQPRRDEETGISEPIPFPQPRRAQIRNAPESEPPRTDPPPGESTAPDPMPQRRIQAASVAAVAAATLGVRTETASAHFEETSHPTRIDSVFSLANALDEIADGPVSASEAAEFAQQTAQTPPEPIAEQIPPESMAFEPEDDSDTPELSDETALAMAVDEIEPESDSASPEEAESTRKVSDLEEEMARLLGEITSRRDS
jgi:hypothetical protein